MRYLSMMRNGQKEGESLAYLIPLDSILKTRVALWIQIIGPHKDVLFPGWDSERAYTSHDIAYRLTGFKEINHTSMLSIQSRIPIDLRIIKSESAFLRPDFHIQVWVARKKFVLKGAELALRAHYINFVDNCADVWVLVHEDGGNYALAREIFLSQIQVRFEIKELKPPLSS